ncbi:MAG: exodeoxyribonuclease VII small subunit [Gemmatimonadota bacterium]
MSSSSSSNPTLEELAARLERIARSLESEPMELDGAIALFEEAVGHLRRAEEILAAAELRIDELVGEGERARLEPFEAEDA